MEMCPVEIQESFYVVEVSSVWDFSWGETKLDSFVNQKKPQPKSSLGTNEYPLTQWSNLKDYLKCMLTGQA